MNKLKEIISNLMGTARELDITPDDNCIFENAVKIYISNSINENKKQNIEAIKDYRGQGASKTTPPEPPTEQQLNFLKKKGIKEIPKSKREAWTKIKEIKDKEKEEW